MCTHSIHHQLSVRLSDYFSIELINDIVIENLFADLGQPIIIYNNRYV